MKILEVVHPEALERVVQSIQESIQKCTDWEVEFRVIKDNHKIEYFLGRSQIEKQNDNSLVWYGIIKIYRLRRNMKRKWNK